MRRIIKYIVLSMIASSIFSAVEMAKDSSVIQDLKNNAKGSCVEMETGELPLDTIAEQGAVAYFVQEFKNNTEGTNEVDIEKIINPELEQQLSVIHSEISSKRAYVGDGISCMMEICPDGGIILYDQRTDNVAYLNEKYRYSNMSEVSGHNNVSEEYLMTYIKDYLTRGEAATNEIIDEYKESIGYEGELALDKIYADQNTIQFVFVKNDAPSVATNSLINTISSVEAFLYNWVTSDLE